MKVVYLGVEKDVEPFALQYIHAGHITGKSPGWYLRATVDGVDQSLAIAEVKPLSPDPSPYITVLNVVTHA